MKKEVVSIEPNQVDLSIFTPIEVLGDRSPRQYYKFECKECGKEDRNSFCDPHYTNMIKHQLCFTCDYHRMWAEENKGNPGLTIIKGHVYAPGNRTEGAFRGMSGRRFDIEYIPPSPHAGKRVTTYDLWSGSTIPEKYRGDFPDTARFLGDASKEQVGDITCWNPSDGKEEPYPLPKSLGIGLKR